MIYVTWFVNVAVCHNWLVSVCQITAVGSTEIKTSPKQQLLNGVIVKQYAAGNEQYCSEGEGCRDKHVPKKPPWVIWGSLWPAGYFHCARSEKNEMTLDQKITKQTAWSCKESRCHANHWSSKNLKTKKNKKTAVWYKKTHPQWRGAEDGLIEEEKKKAASFSFSRFPAVGNKEKQNLAV